MITEVIVRERTDDSAIAQAQKLLHTFFPEAEPIEPARFYIKDFPTYVGAYFGSVDGTHQYFYKPTRGLLNVVRDPLTIIHEECHQKHAEIIGQERYNGETWESYLDANSIPRESLEDVFSSTFDEKHRVNFEEVDYALTDTIKEGWASFVEFEVMKAWLDSVKEDQDSELREKLERYNNRSQLVYETKFRRHPHDRVYPEGKDLISLLFEEGGIELVLEFLRSVDYEFTDTIQLGSNEYPTFLQNPLSIPVIA